MASMLLTGTTRNTTCRILCKGNDNTNHLSPLISFTYWLVMLEGGRESVLTRVLNRREIDYF